MYIFIYTHVTSSISFFLYLILVLSRIKEFLPQMEQANRKLEEKMKSTTSEFDIEAVNSTEPYIEMVCAESKSRLKGSVFKLLLTLTLSTA